MSSQSASLSPLMEAIDLMLREAGQQLMARMGKDVHPRAKADQSIVTDADLASEAVILDQIRRNFPDDVVWAEESGASHKVSEGQSVWIVDPLDGTTNYANNYPLFCVSIARGVHQGGGHYLMEAGGIFAPALGRTYLAEAGKGAFLNGKRLKVGSPRPLHQSFLVTGFAYQRGPRLTAEIQRFSQVAQHCSGIRRDGTAALDMAMVAEGIYDGFWEWGLAPWDVAAGIVLVQEAGGIVTTYDGHPFRFDGDGLICGQESRVWELQKLIALN